MRSRALTIALLIVLGAPSTQSRARQAPAFRAGVDLVAVDVQVVTSDGQPIAGLSPDKFEVSINGRRRRVVSAEMVRHGVATPEISGRTSALTSKVVAQPPTEARTYIVAIDVMSFRPEATRLVTSAARGFIERLQPNDLVGLAAFPAGPEAAPTTDHAAVLGQLDAVVGRGEAPGSAANRFGLNPSDIVDITAAIQREPSVDLRNAGPRTALGRAIDAVCAYDRDVSVCRRSVASEAQMLAIYEEGLGLQRLGALRDIVGGLARRAGRKTVVLVSAGLPATDVTGGRPDLGDLGQLVGQEAARANSTIYSVHVDTPRMDAVSASSDARPRPTNNPGRDSAILVRPLDHVAGLSGGTRFTVVQGGGEPVFDQIRNETSAVYLLGVEPDRSDRTGEPRRLNVKVDSGQRGAAIRARSWVVVPLAGTETVPARAPASPTEPAAPKVAITAPSAADVAAYERLWSGAGAGVRAEPEPVAVPPAALSLPNPRRPTPFDALYDEYTAGRRTVVLERLRTPEDFERYRADMIATIAEWSKAWSPRRAAFALEVALAAFARRWPNPQAFLTGARNIVTGRPDAPGVRPEDDRFEVRFHRAAVAILAAAEGPHGVDTYLTSIQDRVVLSSTPPKSAMLTDARLVMARATAREIQTLMLLLSVGSRREAPRSWIVAKDDGRTRRQLEEVSQLLEFAASHDDVRAEASVRRAFILYRLGANQDALTLLEGAAPTDDVVDYWRALIQGRVLLALGRQQDAIASFERATMLKPDAQTPAVALTSIFLRLDDREQALGWAERARTTTENRGDPWPQYWNGSTRFLQEWLADLREFQP